MIPATLPAYAATGAAAGAILRFGSKLIRKLPVFSNAATTGFLAGSVLGVKTADLAGGALAGVAAFYVADKVLK